MLAGVGALAFGITSGHPSIANWRVLFLVEGLPNVVLAVAVFFLLPDSPETARFLTQEEKEVAKARAILQTGREGKYRIGGINMQEALSAFKSPQTWLQPLMYFSCNVSFASLPVFLPAILTSMGYSSINAQGSRRRRISCRFWCASRPPISPIRRARERS